LIAASAALLLVFAALTYPPSGAGAAPAPCCESAIQIPSISASASNSSLGVGLVLDLSGAANGNVTIVLSLVNLRNSTNVVPFAQDWAYDSGSMSWSDGCAFSGPLAFGVFDGNLSAADYSNAQSLALFNTNVMRSCIEYLAPTSLPPLGNSTVRGSTGGYWTGGYETSTPGVFTTFAPGTYTVLGEDEWGQALLLHFAVPGTATASSNSSSATLPQKDYWGTVFGFAVNSSGVPTMAFPNGTLIWTDYVVPNSVYIESIEAVLITTPSTPHSTAIMGAYVDGTLVGQDTYQIGPPTPPSSQPNYTLPANFTSYDELSVPFGSTVQAGATVSVAAWCSSPPTMYLDENDSLAHGTFEAPLQPTAALPSSLPSASQRAPYGPDFWAFSADVVSPTVSTTSSISSSSPTASSTTTTTTGTTSSATSSDLGQASSSAFPDSYALLVLASSLVVLLSIGLSTRRRRSQPAPSYDRGPNSRAPRSRVQ